MTPNPGTLLHFLLCLTCWHRAAAQVFDFESASDERWTTVNRTFYRAEAGSQSHVPGIPKLDTTNRSLPGHYGLALYEPRKEQVYLVSQCLEPTGPDCRIEFKAMFKISGQVSVLTMQQCNCKRDVHPRTMFKARASPTHAGEGWLPFNITLGRHAVSFEITIATILLDRNEFLAIDDIELIGCDPVPKPPPNCPSESPFYCAGSGECRSRDQLCDRNQDCMCGEDEAEDLC
ncbi:uncharacterized protein LOC131951404, partial [Physella acuta]|uniref:uncharacterized protein LOC131951404 n=1 Tax=Physella acuta TaxID=109671 RepID=UPI0027DDED8D